MQLRTSKHKDGGPDTEKAEVIPSVLVSCYSCGMTEEIQEEYEWKQLSLDRHCIRMLLVGKYDC